MNEPQIRQAGLAAGAGALTALLGVAALLRALALFRMPVAHDEIHVVAYGLARCFLSGDPRELLISTPFAVSNGITPLWFWIQAIPAALFGLTSPVALRLVPFLLGLAGTALAWSAGGRAGGPWTRWFAGLFYAASGLLLYANGRGEFAESLIAPLMLLIYLDLDRGGRGEPVPWRVAIWPGLILFTYLGKGLPVWAVYSAALAVLWLRDRHVEGGGSRLGPARLGALVVLPILPSLAWLAAVQASLFGEGRPVFTDIGPTESAWRSVWSLTFGYGSQVKEFMVGSWQSALYIYTDHAVWPAAALLAVPAAAGMGRLMLAAVRAVSRSRWNDAVRASIPCLLVIPIFFLIVSKGMFSSRFHLLYLPVLLPQAARSIEIWIGYLREGRWRPWLSWGTASILYCSWAASWSDRRAGAHDWKLFVLLCLAGVTLMATAAGMSVTAPRLRRAVAAGAGGLLAAVILTGSLTAGFLDWGRRYAWEPELRPTLPDLLDAAPNAELELARFYVGRESWLAAAGNGGVDFQVPEEREVRADIVKRGRPLLIAALERHPDDGATVREVSRELWAHIPADREMVAGVLDRYLERHPGDRETAALARRLRSVP